LAQVEPFPETVAVLLALAPGGRGEPLAVPLPLPVPLPLGVAEGVPLALAPRSASGASSSWARHDWEDARKALDATSVHTFTWA
jgi:hypothetical protein